MQSQQKLTLILVLAKADKLLFAVLRNSCYLLVLIIAKCNILTYVANYQKMITN